MRGTRCNLSFGMRTRSGPADDPAPGSGYCLATVGRPPSPYTAFHSGHPGEESPPDGLRIASPEAGAAAISWPSDRRAIPADPAWGSEVSPV